MRKTSVIILVLLSVLISSCGPATGDIKNMRVVSAQPTETKVSSESFPLPNCGGTSPLRQTLGTHAGITKSVTIGTKATMKGGGEVEIPATAKLELEIGIEGYYQKTFDLANSRLDMIDMTAAEGTHVVYEIGWYEASFSSIVEYALDGQVYETPYIYKLRVPKIDSSHQETCSTAQATLVTGNGEITLWHAFGTGSSEEIALNTILQSAATDLPNIKINIVQVPFGDIFNKYRNEVAAGGGPDMYIAPNDSIGDDARAGLIADITSFAAGKIGNYSQIAIDGMSVGGRLYGIPESQKAVVLWYNKDLLSTPPATTDHLKRLMEQGTPIGIAFGCYHHFGFFSSFGGEIFDNNWNFIADQGGGVTNTMNYLSGLYQISKSNGWPRSDSESLSPFIEGRIAGVTNGNWAMGDYKNALGNKLGVAPIPTGPGGPAKPMLGIDGFYFNPNSLNKEIALEVALYMTNTKSQTIMMNDAGHVPVNLTVDVTDPVIQGLIAAFRNGYVRPQEPQLAKYWTNFCATDQVFEVGVPAADWVRQATLNANK